MSRASALEKPDAQPRRKVLATRLEAGGPLPGCEGLRRSPEAFDAGRVQRLLRRSIRITSSFAAVSI